MISIPGARQPNTTEIHIFRGQDTPEFIMNLPTSKVAKICNLIVRLTNKSITSVTQSVTHLPEYPVLAEGYHHSAIQNIPEALATGKAEQVLYNPDQIIYNLLEPSCSNPYWCKNKTTKLAIKKRRRRLGERISLRYR